MGTDKATIVLDNEPLIKRIYGVARTAFDNIVVVSSYHNELPGIKAEIVRDIVPMQGPLVGIVSALVATGADYVFALACDMPFLVPGAMKYVLDNAAGEDIVIPKTSKGYEPFHALYRRSCISSMLSAIERGARRVTDIFPYLVVRVLGESPAFFCNGTSVFTNINTREDLEKLFIVNGE